MTEFYNFKDGEKFRLLPPWPVGFFKSSFTGELPPLGYTNLGHKVTVVPHYPYPWSKFGFGCPFCEALLNQYPEDRGEGGIE